MYMHGPYSARINNQNKRSILCFQWSVRTIMLVCPLTINIITMYIVHACTGPIEDDMCPRLTTVHRHLSVLLPVQEKRELQRRVKQLHARDIELSEKHHTKGIPYHMYHCICHTSLFCHWLFRLWPKGVWWNVTCPNRTIVWMLLTVY